MGVPSGVLSVLALRPLHGGEESVGADPANLVLGGVLVLVLAAAGFAIHAVVKRRRAQD